MSTEIEYGAIKVVGEGIDFDVVSFRDEIQVEIAVEFPDYSGWSGARTAERYLSLSVEDWRAVVDHVDAAIRAKKAGARS